jgi:RHS repeat-associated protein
LASIFLVLLHLNEASACTYPPTAVIVTSPSGTIFYNGNPVLLNGSNSTANNGGSINQYRWQYRQVGTTQWTQIYQGTQPTRNFTFPALGSGESQKSYQIQLQVRNTSNQTHTTTITVTLKHAPDRYYYVKDHLGSVRLTLGEDGGIVSWNDYDPWGLALAGRSGVVGSADARYQFTSQERDNETGYDYFGARYYDARMGRWGSIDPLAGKYPGISPYVYVANNPLIYFDPDGRAIYRKGEGYISGHRAKELTLQAIGRVLQGRSAHIDFIQRENTWEDIKDIFRGGTYRHGGTRDPSAVIVGNQLSRQTPRGTQRLSELYVQTAYSFEDLSYSNAELRGTTTSGEELVTLWFTAGEGGQDVVGFTNTIGEVNEFLTQYNKELVRHTQQSTVRNRQTGEMTTREKVWYTLEDIKNENERR